jgi:DNA-binding PadR family transcriptional regulator
MAKAKKTALTSADLDACSCAGRHLDKFIQPAVMAILAKEPQHGYALMEQIKAMPMLEGQAADAAGVYRLLNAMQEHGLVQSHWDTSGSGPAKKLFCLTDSGRECLARWLGTLNEYHHRLGEMLTALRKTAGRRPSSKTCGCRK